MTDQLDAKTEPPPSKNAEAWAAARYPDPPDTPFAGFAKRNAAATGYDVGTQHAQPKINELVNAITEYVKAYEDAITHNNELQYKIKESTTYQTLRITAQKYKQ